MSDFVKKKILLVDDDSDFLEIVQTFLKRTDSFYDLQVASTPEEGVELVNQQSFDCVISDYRLSPDFNGLDLLENLRNKSKDTPFIMVSSCRVPELHREMLKNSAAKFIAKSPDFLQKITESVDSILNIDRSARTKIRLERIKRNQTVSLEKLCSEFFKLHPDISLITAPDGRTLLAANDKAREFFGYSKFEQGTSVILTAADHHRQLLRLFIMKVIQRKKAAAILELKDRDGNSQAFRVRGVLHEFNGTIQSVMITARPVAHQFTTH